MKTFFMLMIAATLGSMYSCNSTSTGDKKAGDSSLSGLEGTRDDASQLSNATIDTSSGQSKKGEEKDSTFVKKDTLSIKK